MIFDKEFLSDLSVRDYVEVQADGDSRWLNHYTAVFEHGGRFYRTQFSLGKSEAQEYRKYEDDPDQIECPEVWPVKRVIEVVEYTTKKPEVA